MVIGGGAGLLLASNIAASPSLAVVSGYFISYDHNNISIVRLDNIAWKGSTGFEPRTTPICLSFPTAGVNLLEAHLIEVVVRGDGQYRVKFDGKPVCSAAIDFTDRVHPAPAKIAVVGINSSGDTDNVLEVRSVRINPLP